MATRGLKIVRFRGRYYIVYNHWDSYYEGFGACVVAGVPADPREYRRWLKSMREFYEEQERALEQHVYETRDGSTPEYTKYGGYEELPSELPRLEHFGAEYFYIIDLDREVLTMNFGVHWRLGNIPRKDDLWLHAIKGSICPGAPTISLDICPEEHMASLALELPEYCRKIGYNTRVVTPKMDMTKPYKVFLTRALANVVLEHENIITWFGGEWSPDSFPFRQFVFSLVSIASGQAKFQSLPSQYCNPWHCYQSDCKKKHLPMASGGLDQECAENLTSLLEFGSMARFPGDPPGVAPTETMYWLENVLVSLTLMVDGQAITSAVDWGIKQQRAEFQMVVLSLFEVVFAEVFLGDDGEPFVKVSDSVHLSHLRQEHCVSTHPRERPELKPGTERHHRDRARTKTLKGCFPGLTMLVHFFDVAASRRASSRLSFTPPINSSAVGAGQDTAAGSPVTLPTELQHSILDFVNYDTWKNCLVVSQNFRSYCLRKYRLDDQMSIVADPLVKHSWFTFNLEDMQKGSTLQMVFSPPDRDMEQYCWMPVIGSDRKAVMTHVKVQFAPWPTRHVHH